MAYRLTQYAAGGGCACKIPPGELEAIVRGLGSATSPDVLVGLDSGDDGAVIQVADGVAVISTADFFTPVVDDAYDFGRIAAANALSDVYAMGGRPVVALNLVGWPRSVLPDELLREVLRGGLDVARLAGCAVAGGHSIDDPEPKYGMAVTGVADPDHLLRNDCAQPGLPLSLTKPLGVGVLNNRHKATGEAFPQAVDSMTRLNSDAAEQAVAGGVDGCDRRHRLRVAWAPVQDAAGIRRRCGAGQDCGAVSGRRPCIAGGGLREWRDSSQPRLGATTPRLPASARTNCSCWPMPRHPVGC